MPENGPERGPKRRIDRETSISVWFDTRQIGWGTAFVAVGLLFLILSVSAGMAWLGVVSVVCLVLLFVREVYFARYEDFKTTGVALGFRRLAYYLSSKSGRTVTFANLDGEPLGNARKKSSPAIIEPIGRVQFIPHRLANGGILGIAWDHRYNTYSATMSCSFQSIFSDDYETRQRRLDGFARLLSSFAETGSLVDRFSWRWQTLNGERQNPEQIVEALQAGAQLTREDCPNREVFLDRTAEMGEDSPIHRVTMTLSICDSGPPLRRLAKSVGGMPELLVQQLEVFYGLAMGTDSGRSPIGLKAANFLSYNDLIQENLLALNPVRAQPLWQRQDWLGPASEQDFLDEQLAWPEYADFKPESVQLGQTYHQCFNLWEFTRSGFVPEQLWEILETRIPKTVTVVFGMVPTDVALTRSTWSANAAAKASTDRVSGGRRLRATEKLAEDATTTREMEIASSEGEDGQVACYLDIWGATPEECDAHAKRLHQAGSKARFVIMPLTHRQARGIEAAMPIGRGLAVPPTSRWLRWLS